MQKRKGRQWFRFAFSRSMRLADRSQQLVGGLGGNADGAAANIHKLGRTPSNIKVIENCFEQVAHRARRVKRWNGARMILRWSASALLWAEKRFKRVNGCEQLKDLERHLRSSETISTLQAA